jgi:hypothetical protein
MHIIVKRHFKEFRFQSFMVTYRHEMTWEA